MIPYLLISLYWSIGFVLILVVFAAHRDDVERDTTVGNLSPAARIAYLMFIAALTAFLWPWVAYDEIRWLVRNNGGQR